MEVWKQVECIKPLLNFTVGKKYLAIRKGNLFYFKKDNITIGRYTPMEYFKILGESEMKKEVVKSCDDDTCKYCGHVGLSFSRDINNAGYYCGECGKFDKPKAEEKVSKVKKYVYVCKGCSDTKCKSITTVFDTPHSCCNGAGYANWELKKVKGE